MNRPQFTRQHTRPLSPRAIAGAVRRGRELLDIIERYSEATEPREKAKLTQAIHGLSLHAQTLSRRHRRSNGND